MWWCVLVVPATQETEAGESLDARRWNCSEPRLRHCTPAWVIRVKLRLQKKKEKNLEMTDAGEDVEK